ncbi:hypothetical protein O181_035696, partial [Austropuccinia psidii MF-1]|nr:hypothetical protein [Austropuccinia psidii MF-1]
AHTNLPPQDLGVIVSAILSLRYNIPHRASPIVSPALNLLIKSSISSSGGHPTPAFNIPQDCNTIFEHLQLEPVIQDYICCPQCKLINSFEPHTQQTTNMKQTFIPTKHFIYQPFKNWLDRFLQQSGIMEILHQQPQSQIPKGFPKCDIWDGLVWRCFTGTGNTNDPPFMSIPGELTFSIYVDWFNAHGKSTWLASIGSIMLICCNLPLSEIVKPENVYVAGIIPGPKEPIALQLNSLLMPLIKELKELWQGYLLSTTSTGPSGSFIHVAILTAISNLVSMSKLTGFISHSGKHFCSFCTIHKAQIEEIGPQFHYTCSYQNHKSTIAKWLWASPQQRQAIFSEYRV